MFAEGKPLGPNGLNWLKVHLVNIHGQLKKSSLEERIQYADQHLDEIFDSADQPFDVSVCLFWFLSISVRCLTLVREKLNLAFLLYFWGAAEG